MSTTQEEATRTVHLLNEVTALTERAFAGPSSGGYRELVERLDELARKTGRDMFAASLTFEPYYRNLLGFDYADHEWAALLVASAVPEVSDPSVQAGADKLLDSATRALLAKPDHEGQGFAYFVRGKRSLYKGRLDEAATFWRLARDLLRDQSPVEEMNTAYLALRAFQDGDLRGCRKVAEEALELAKLRSNLRAEAFSRLLLAFFAIYEGSFAQAEAELVLSDATFERIPDESQRIEHPLVQTGLGALHAFRGDYAEADRYFAKGLAMTETITLTQRYAAVTRAVSAELTAHERPERAVHDAQQARDFWPEGVGGIWLAWALRGGGVAERVLGHFDESLRLLQQAYGSCGNPFERGRSLLEMGKTLLVQRKHDSPDTSTKPGTPGAAEQLSRAADLFVSLNAHYWLTQTYLLLAEADPDNSKVWQGKARTTALDDRAYTKLFQSDGYGAAGPEFQLRIRLHGEAGVFVGELAVSFPTKHAELLVYALALAGRAGANRAELVEKIWPGADLKQASQKLRTALWQAKVSLGSEDWRLTRSGERLFLALESAYVDDFAASTEIEQIIDLGAIVFAGTDGQRAPDESKSRVLELKDRKLMNAANKVRHALETLEAPLLPRWSGEEWVRKEHATRLAQVAECRRLLDNIADTLASMSD